MQEVTEEELDAGDGEYTEFAAFQVGGQDVRLETRKDTLYICLPEGCVELPATSDNLSKWLTFFEKLERGADPDAG